MKLLKSKYSLLILLSSFVVVLIASIGLVSGGDEMRFVSTNLYLTYVLVIVLAILVLGFSIKELIRSKKSLITMGLGLGILGILFIITYSRATSSLDNLNISVPATPAEVQFVGALTSSTIALVVLGIAVLVFMELKKMIQNG